jgi:hypothetical protein
MFQGVEKILTSHLSAKVDQYGETSAIQQPLSTSFEEIKKALLSS